MNHQNERNLLIVEDEADLREILVAFLEPLRVNIFQASNGREAIDILRNNEIHAVVTDIMMPEMTGLELLAQMKVNHADIPVAIVSALSDKETIKQGLRLGAFDYIEKPYSEEEVIEVSNRILEVGVRAKRIHQIEGDRGTLSIEEKSAAVAREKKMVRLLSVTHNETKKREAG